LLEEFPGKAASQTEKSQIELYSMSFNALAHIFWPQRKSSRDMEATGFMGSQTRRCPRDLAMGSSVVDALGDTQKAKAESEGDLADTTKERDEDQKYFDDTAALCQEKAADFESRQALRAEEIKTLKIAIDVIASDTVAGAGERHLPREMALSQSAAFAQIVSTALSPVQQHIADFLADRAKATGSNVSSYRASDGEDSAEEDEDEAGSDGEIAAKPKSKSKAEGQHKPWASPNTGLWPRLEVLAWSSCGEEAVGERTTSSPARWRRGSGHAERFGSAAMPKEEADEWLNSEVDANRALGQSGLAHESQLGLGTLLQQT